MKIDNFFRTSFLLGTLFYLSIALISDVYWLIAGGTFISIVFFFFLHIGLVLLAILLFVKYKHPLGIFGRLFFLVAIGYMSMRFLIPELMVYKPVAFGFSIMHFILLGTNAIFTLVEIARIIYEIISGTNKENRLTTKNVFTLVNTAILTFSLIWILMASWSYVGFSTTITIIDPSTSSEPSDMRVSFYGYPFGGYDPDYYLTPEWDQEAEFYLDMETVFVVPWSRDIYFPINASKLANRTATFHALDAKGIRFMVCLGPLHTDTNQGDFYSYYYCEEINQSIDETVDWVLAEGFTNFYGIQIDPEGPKWDTDNEGNPIIINASQHAFAAQSTQNKIDEFKADHPDWLFTTISVTTAYFDWVDGDRDNDIILKSISAEPLDVDYYGWQTYSVQQDRDGPNNYYDYLKMGKQHYGQKFNPWIGWYNGNNNYLDYPEYHENTLTQLKLCKALEVDEVFIAASYRYFPTYSSDLSNFDDLVDLLSDLNTTRNEQFETFTMQNNQKHYLYSNFALWLEKITPYHFVKDGMMLLDVYCELQFEWLFFFEIAQAVLVIVISVKFSKKQTISIKNKN